MSGSGNPLLCGSARKEIFPGSFPGKGGKGGGGAEGSPAFFKASFIKLICFPFLRVLQWLCRLTDNQCAPAVGQSQRADICRRPHSQAAVSPWRSNKPAKSPEW